MPIAGVCRKLVGSEKTYYLWKEQYAHLLSNELRGLRRLLEENAKLKRLVADLTLEKVMVQAVGEKEGSPRRSANGSRFWRASFRGPSARPVGCWGLADRPVATCRRGAMTWR